MTEKNTKLENITNKLWTKYDNIMTEFEDELIEHLASMPHRMAQAFDKVIRQIIIDERNSIMEDMEDLEDEST
mgnify:CR=1 FL=1